MGWLGCECNQSVRVRCAGVHPGYIRLESLKPVGVPVRATPLAALPAQLPPAPHANGGSGTGSLLICCRSRRGIGCWGGLFRSVGRIAAARLNEVAPLAVLRHLYSFGGSRKDGGM